MESVETVTDPNGRDEFNRPLIAMAARQGQPNVLKLLIQAGAALDAEDTIGYTALMEAARDKRVDCVRLLLQHGAADFAKDNNERNLAGTISAWRQKHPDA
jgi:ankyrin repeat protein